ncbi:stalk domain-containing protein [Chengkuizengella sp. SCS-71B]|uniref:stalk domain-containing protein n=1 Tax=Chengkuizengella sp. SCS-71B TaxID=3115290 RepID=UPI0032C21F94
MKKSIIGLTVGLLIGLSFSVTSPAFSAVKEYILTEFTQPVLVDGVQYVDQGNPIMNYNGRTYIPLSKIGDIAGLDYRWNNELKQVEISTNNTVDISDENIVLEKDLADPDKERLLPPNLTPELIVIEQEKVSGFVILESYQDYPGEKVAYQKYDDFSDDFEYFVDEDDVNLIRAKDKGIELPPKLTDGWVSRDLLFNIFAIRENIVDTDIYLQTLSLPSEILLELNLNEDWFEKTGKDTINNIRIKRYNYKGLFYNYYNIQDLIEAEVITQ